MKQAVPIDSIELRLYTKNAILYHDRYKTACGLCMSLPKYKEAKPKYRMGLVSPEGKILTFSDHVGFVPTDFQFTYKKYLYNDYTLRQLGKDALLLQTSKISDYEVMVEMQLPDLGDCLIEVLESFNQLMTYFYKNEGHRYQGLYPQEAVILRTNLTSILKKHVPPVDSPLLLGTEEYEENRHKW